MNIKLTINDTVQTFEIAPAETLLQVLRRHQYSEVKRGCEGGHCGSCIVLLNGEPVNSCQVMAGSVDGTTVTTIRGIGTQRQPHIIQQALAEVGAVQCGFCTPAIILLAYVLLRRNPNPSQEEIKKTLDGNLCRCTGYVKIIDGIQLAASRIQKMD